MTAPLVLVTSRSFGTGSVPVRDDLLAAGCEVVSGPPDHDLVALAPVLPRVVAWIAGTGPVTAAHLDAAPNLRVLARYGVGTDAVDLAAAQARGVLVTNTPGANAAAVAEHTLALMLAALRGLPAADRAVRSGAGGVRRTRQLGALTVGIVGLGRIGGAVAGLLRGFGSRLLGVDPLVAKTGLDGVQLVGLEELTRRSELVTLHAPGDEVLVDADFLAAVRPDLILVNTARARLVDEDAVVAALRSGRLAAYAADLLGDEGAPGGAPRSPLLAADLADRTIFTPHAAAHTVEAVDLMGRGAVDAVLAVLRDEPPAHPVTVATRRDSGGSSGSENPAEPLRVARDGRPMGGGGSW